jgi:ParB family chromosome partitioning protein
VKEESLSVRAIEQAVKAHIESVDNHLLPFNESVASSSSAKAPASRPEQIAVLEQELKRVLGTQVAITQNAKGKGKITIQFANGDEFERLRAILTGGETASWMPAAA